MRFTKMHGCGNDFIVIYDTQPPAITLDAIKKLANRRTGIGFDQILWVQPTRDQSTVRMHIINADGSTAGQCGNGLRCVAQFLERMHGQPNSTWTIKNNSGTYTVHSLGNNLYEATLGIPEFTPNRIPFLAPTQQPLYTIHSPWGPLDVGAVSLGNPHVVWCINQHPMQQLESQARFLASCKQFPEGVNVNLVKVISSHQLELNVYERGAGWTQACGSGACATAVVAIMNHWVRGEHITIQQPGGQLTVSWAGTDQPIKLTGASEIVFDGILAGSMSGLPKHSASVL
jgi:diaminopimelate epimerase